MNEIREEKKKKGGKWIPEEELLASLKLPLRDRSRVTGKQQPVMLGFAETLWKVMSNSAWTWSWMFHSYASLRFIISNVQINEESRKKGRHACQLFLFFTFYPILLEISKYLSQNLIFFFLFVSLIFICSWRC